MLHSASQKLALAQLDVKVAHALGYLSARLGKTPQGEVAAIIDDAIFSPSTDTETAGIIQAQLGYELHQENGAWRAVNPEVPHGDALGNTWMKALCRAIYLSHAAKRQQSGYRTPTQPEIRC